MADTERVDSARQALLEALQRARVEFVLIGGAAIESYGLPHRTDDVDVLPQRSEVNLQRLSDVLNALDCKLVVDLADRSQDVPLPAGFFTTANMARQSVWNLATRHGDLGVDSEPAGFPAGYEQMRPGALLRRVAATTSRYPSPRSLTSSIPSAPRPAPRTAITSRASAASTRPRRSRRIPSSLGFVLGPAEARGGGAGRVGLASVPRTGGTLALVTFAASVWLVLGAHFGAEAGLLPPTGRLPWGGLEGLLPLL